MLVIDDIPRDDFFFRHVKAGDRAQLSAQTVSEKHSEMLKKGSAASSGRSTWPTPPVVWCRRTT